MGVVRKRIVKFSFFGVEVLGGRGVFIFRGFGGNVVEGFWERVDGGSFFSLLFIFI